MNDKLKKVSGTAQIVRSNLKEQSNRNAINQQTFDRSRKSIDESIKRINNMDINAVKLRADEMKEKYNRTITIKKSQWKRLKKLWLDSKELHNEMSELPGEMNRMNNESEGLQMKMKNKIKDLDENLKKIIKLQKEFSDRNQMHERALSDAQGK